jgi:hypothetical protein
MNAALRVGFSERLPDCRVYEQVSPVEKNGVDAVLALFPAQASIVGEGSSEASSLAFASPFSFEGSPAIGLPNAYVASRGLNGWRTIGVTPPILRATSPSLNFLGFDFSEDLSQVVIKVPLQTLTPNAPTGVYNLYLRNTEGSPSYSLVTTAPPSVAPPANCGRCFFTEDVPAFAGASEHFSHIIFEANEKLKPNAPGGGVESLYESSGGQIELVGILPDGVSASGGSTAGAGSGTLYGSTFPNADLDVNHAISSDGSRILFQALADGGIPDPAQKGITELYDRLGGSKTIEISAPAKKIEKEPSANPTPEPAQFWGASTDGSRVFFTSSAELTGRSNTGVANAGSALYEYNLNSSELTDLAVDTNPVDAASGTGVKGVVGVSNDGLYVYFVATGQLLVGKGEDAEPNLYVAHGGEVKFIAMLNNEDSNDWTSVPNELQAYVTPDGRHLAFMSINSLTGYDNKDLNNPAQLDSEVYEYTYGAGQLVCASCDPNGGRPIGSAFIGASSTSKIGTPFHQPRILNDEGTRLFFSSPDPLVSGSNAQYIKIFEYENGGIYPISSGVSVTSDIFLDASPSGNDVFFATRDQLVQSDQDNLIDIYDARVEGGFPPALVFQGPCIDTCQGSPGLVPLLPTLASGSLVRSGNLPVSQAAGKYRQRHKAKKHRAKKRHKGRKARRTATVIHSVRRTRWVGGI